MANEILVQLGVVLVPAGILIFALLISKKRKGKTQPVDPVALQVRPVIKKTDAIQPAQPKIAEAKLTISRTAAVQTPTATPAPVNAVNPVATSAAPPAPAPVMIDIQAALADPEERRESILAGISENIRKSLQTMQVAQSSPLPYSESKSSNTEYVRVKKEIITPHGQIRFSILKDWMSSNMLAFFRRASFDWKSPDDLIGFLPAYLEAEAEILHGQVLLIGTSGHNEKLAIPVRSLDDASSLRRCFDFLSSAPGVVNTPAVVVTCDDDLEVVSKGVITQALFTNAHEKGQWEMKLLVERPHEALQKKYSAALQA